MFHIFSVCPSSFIENNIHSNFDSRKGNFISKNIPKNDKSSFTWKNKELSHEEKTKIRNIFDFLERKKAFVTNQAGISGLDKLITHLNSSQCEIENAISEEIKSSDCQKIINSEDFLLNKINTLSKYSDIQKTADHLLSLISPFLLQSYNFKLIDPYFYKSWQSKTPEKLEFLVNLCDYFLKNHRELQSINIEVYGQGYDNDKQRGKPFQKSLTKELRNLKMFEDLYEDGLIEIDFFGLEQINSERKVHDRLFMCDQFSLSLNDGFFSEPGITNEIVLVDDFNRIDKFKEMYSKDTKDFYMEFHFSLEDIFQDN